jgi:hypothetical protein
VLAVPAFSGTDSAVAALQLTRMVTEGSLRSLRIEGCEIQGPVAALVSERRSVILPPVAC